MRIVKESGLTGVRRALLLAFTGAVAFLSGCGGITYNATPQITYLFPSEITAGSQSFTMFVSGSQFISTTTIEWNGTELPTTYNTQTGELFATVPAANVQTAGVAQVTVTSPAPGGGRSLAVVFTINPATSNGPTITSLSPSSAALNAKAFTLTVTGTNFTSSDYVTWNGGLRTTTFSSATQLAAQILATDLTQQEVASVAVHTAQLGVASPSVEFQVGSSTSGDVKFPELISAAQRGVAADGESSSPAVSTDAGYVAFYSKAKNLVSGTMAGNIFLRETCVGESTTCAPSTTAVDIATNGAAPNGPAADHVAISSAGRYVAFASNATNLTSDAVSGAAQSRVFVRDVCIGSSAPCSPHTDVVSVDGEGNVISGGEPSISADGRFVAFTTPAVAAGTAGSASVVMVRDTCNGASALCASQTVVASIDGAKQISVDPNAASSISSSGRYVAFTNQGNGTTPAQIFVRDTCLGFTGSECVPSTVVVSVARDGQMGNGSSSLPAISGDGRFVVFDSAASNLADGSTGSEQIYLRDTCTGPTAPFGCTPSTTQISGDVALPGNASGSYSPSISASGRYISYLAQKQNGNAMPGSETTSYIVVYDTCFGAAEACSPHAAELSAAGAYGNQSPLTGDVRVTVPITDDGFAAFFTQQSVPTVRASGLGDVFLATTPFRQ
jgi:hypothetical protein